MGEIKLSQVVKTVKPSSGMVNITETLANLQLEEHSMEDLSPLHRGLNVYVFKCRKHGIFASKETFEFPGELDESKSSACLKNDCSDTPTYSGFQKA
jgi:hypothetical protein